MINLPLPINAHTLMLFCTMALAGVCFFFSFFLGVHGSKNATTRYLLVLCSCWAVLVLLPLFTPMLDADYGEDIHFQPLYVFSAIIIGELTTFYPLLVICSGKMTIRQGVIFFIPLAVFLVLFFVWYSGSTDSFYRVGLNQVPVWKWKVFCSVGLVYMYVHAIYTLIRLRKFGSVYDQYLKETYTEDDHKSAGWMQWLRYPGYILLGCWLLYFVWDSVWSDILLCVSVMAVMYVLVSQALFTEPVELPKGYHLRWVYWTSAWEVDREDYRHVQDKRAVVEENTSSTSDSRLLTDKQVQEYKQRLDAWMQQEKPYLHADFRVAHIHAYLGIGRLACNELFDRAYQSYFRAWVGQYRMDAAIRLLKECSDVQMKEIAYACGYSSQAVFSRAFAEKTGMSATEYRKKVLRAE